MKIIGLQFNIAWEKPEENFAPMKMARVSVGSLFYGSLRWRYPADRSNCSQFLYFWTDREKGNWRANLDLALKAMTIAG